ncbi:hypothetical protein WJX72_004316 [[Myrmecia] bisecta]|uniref:Disease resistance protein Roq1-like winged-helix domain-containing protein n=1 Tax=[Myrmecia] bisecta TaxID=41462 RepID=A0AAW1P3P4_9CHLO
MGRAIEARGPGMQQDLSITDRKRLWLSDEEQVDCFRKASGALPNLAGLHATAYLSRVAELDLRGSDLASLPDKLPAALQELDLLSLSYDSLNPHEQDMFLTACWLVGKSVAVVKRMWARSGLPAETGLAALERSSMVTVDKDGNLAMHDLLRDMGRAIVGCRPRMPTTERKRMWLVV